jgi:peptide/nickel transport system substrate-binding protein
MSLGSMKAQQFLALTEDYARRHALSRRAFVAAAGAAGALAVGGGDAWAQTAKRGGVLRMGRAEEPDTFDPHKAISAIGSATMLLFLEPPARLDANGKIVPAFAQSWELADQNRTLIFHLRPGATFHDGTPANSAAVVYTVHRHLDPATASPTKAILGPLEKAEAIDDMTVAYHYREPFVPIWVGLTSSYCGIISPTAMEASKGGFGRNPVGSGPFRFKYWTPDRGLRVERFDGYKPYAPPLLDALETIQYPEDATRLAALDSGEINGIYFGQSVPPDRVRSLKGNDDITLLSKPAQSMRAIAFNQQLAPMNNPKVRQALSHAVDARKAVALGLDDNAKVAHGPLASTIIGYSPAVEHLGYLFDPAKARQLLAEAGVGSALSLRMLTNDQTAIRRTAEVVQAQLKDVGVAVEVQSVPLAQWVALSKKGDYHLTYTTYSYPEADVLYLYFHSTGSLNRNFGGTPELDSMLAAQRVEFDPAKRQALLDKIQATIVTDAYWIPLFEPLSFAALSKSVHGEILRVDGDLNFPTIWMDA